VIVINSQVLYKNYTDDTQYINAFLDDFGVDVKKSMLGSKPSLTA
jgi:hypothetical protein